MGVRKLGVDVYDALGLVGFVALEYGIARWSASAAWMVGGVLMLVAALWPDLRKKRTH